MRWSKYLILVLFLAVLGGIWCVVAARQAHNRQPDPQLPNLANAAVQGDGEAAVQSDTLPEEAKASYEKREKEWERLRQAARQGDARAQYELGCGCTEHWREAWYRPLAVKWLMRAAEQGVGEAWVALGNLYAEGAPGILQDIARAREHYKKAEEKANPRIWHDLGGIYRWGKGGIVADWPRSLDCYLKAARQGDEDAQYIVGQFYQYGIGTAVDLTKAVDWYTKAARQGHFWAEEKLGWLYEHGTGVAKDRRQAINWFKKAERHGGACWAHLVRLKDPETLQRALNPPQPVPTTKDVELALETEKAEYELDELVIVSVCYRNVGKESYSFTEGHSGGFRCLFSVKDAGGQELPNPYADQIRFHMVNEFLSIHILEPGTTVVRKTTLNQGVHFERPGTYTVRAGRSVHRGKGGGLKGEQESLEIHAKPITLKIRPCDPEKRRRDIQRLVDAYPKNKEFPEGLTRPAEMFGGSLDIIRRLVMYNEPTLRPFFLDVLRHDVNSFAETGLRALPDRAGVLKALEARLEQPEKYPSLDLLHPYLRLAGLYDDDVFGEPGRLDNWKRVQEITRKCQDKALELVRRDTHYRYGYLVPGLLGRGDDLFLIDYLSRCRPDFSLVQYCTHAIQTVKLGREHIPFLVSLLDKRDWGVTDAAIVQLVRLDRDRYLPELKEHPKNFSPGVVKLLLEPEDE